MYKTLTLNCLVAILCKNAAAKSMTCEFRFYANSNPQSNISRVHDNFTVLQTVPSCTFKVTMLFYVLVIGILPKGVINSKF